MSNQNLYKMKKLIFSSVLMLIASINAFTQGQDEKAIKELITAFSLAGDQNDAVALDNYLDDHYRVVMNRLFGSKEVSIMNKEVYLEKIRNKEFGGDNRKVNIEQITLNGTTATVKVLLEGSKMSFNSLITLVKDEENKWKLISDVPIVK